MFKSTSTLIRTFLMVPFMWSIGAQATSSYTTKEVNDLKLEKRALVERRAATLTMAVQNESELDLLLRYADGEDLSVLMDKALPAAGTVAAGGAVDLWGNKKLPARLSELLKKMPRLLRISSQRLPSVVGVAVAALMAYDSLEYNDQVNRLKDMDETALKAEHDRLLSRREMYVQSMKMIDERILKLDLQLSAYTK